MSQKAGIEVFMRLVSLLNAHTIYIEQRETTLEQVFSNLVELICHHYRLPVCGNRLLELIRKREAEGSTIYPTGIAIPHVRMDDFDDTVIGICFLHKPLIIDGFTLRMVVLIITDKSSSKLYLNLVSTLLKLTQNAGMMSLLMSEDSAGDVMVTFKKFDLVIKEDLTIGDIMTGAPVFVRPQTTLAEMGNLMRGHGISVFPVVDQNMRFLGEVSILNYLKVGIPDYLMLMDNLQFLRSFEPLERLFEKEMEICAGEIMQEVDVFLSPDASIIETVFEMIRHNKRMISIVQDGKLVGVITAMDIYNKVIRA